jgi:adenosylmethionine-8-amino-7-oxononanoate aminotransferase
LPVIGVDSAFGAAEAQKESIVTMASQANASRVFHRSLTGEIAHAEGGQGAYLRDTKGRQYLDASGGAAVSCLGHGDPRIIAAVKQQLDRLAFAHTSFFTNAPAEQLAEVLSAKAPGGNWRVYFVSGGSEANETALKLARQVQVERGKGSRDHFIARHQSYHGNTLGALSVSGNAGRKELYRPILNRNVRHIMPCYGYRHQGPEESDAAFGLRAAQALEAEIADLGPERAIAFVAETVVGSTLGAVPPAPGYFREIRRICDAHGVLLLLDEVMSGMGRTGTHFACEQDGVVPDMIAIAKGLGAGYQPVGALMVREEIVQEIETGSGAFQHGHTYVGHATACAAALAVQKVFDEDRLVERVAAKAPVFEAVLKARFANHEHVGDIRGRGFFRGIELVRDRQTKEPFAAGLGLAAKIKNAAMRNGLVCYPDNRTVDGTNGDHVLLAPPFIIEDAQFDELAEKLGASLDEALADVKS